MKKFKVSDMVHNRRELLEAARNGGAVIERRESNGEVIEEFILCLNEVIAADEIHINHEDDFKPLDFCTIK